MDRWLRSFAAAIAADDLLDGVRRLVVAVSGGPDSVCLLELFHEWVREVDPSVEILVGHVHHGIRGQEADRDAAFVERIAAEKGLVFLCERGDACRLAARDGLSLEVAARRLRYDAFRTWAQDHDVDCVALGQHFDDQAETVVLRAIRGSGLPGLGGIPRRRTLPMGNDLRRRRRGRSVTIIRPLLEWRRRDVLSFLGARRLSARQDSTNSDLEIPRNRVRREVLPALERAQPGAVVSLARLGELARRVREDLRELGERAFSEAQKAERPGHVVLDAAPLASWPESVLREVIALAKRRVLRAAEAPAGAAAEPWACARPVVPLKPCEHFVRALRRWLRSDGHGAKVVELGDGVKAELRYGRVSVCAQTSMDGIEPSNDAPAALRPPVLPDVTGGARWGGWTFSFSWFTVASPGAMTLVPPRGTRGGLSEPETDAASSIERFDLDVLESCGPLRVRSRRSGDVFHPLGAPGRKKLKEFFREHEVEPTERDRVPLFASGETIQWVVGCRIGHLARCRPETRRVLELKARREPQSY